MGSVRSVGVSASAFSSLYRATATVSVANRSEKTYEFSCRAVDLLSGKGGDVFSIEPLSAAIFKIKRDDSYVVYEKIKREE